MKIPIVIMILLLVTSSDYAAQKALKRSYIEAFEQELLAPSPTTEEASSINVTPLSDQDSLFDFAHVTSGESLTVCQEFEIKPSEAASVSAEGNGLETGEQIDSALHALVGRAYNCCVKDKDDELTAAWIIALETEDMALLKKIFMNYFQRYYIDVNYQNKSGKTALILAAQEGDFDFVIALTLCEGAFLNLRDLEGKNAQFYALVNKRTDIAQFLLNLEKSYKQMIA